MHREHIQCMYIYIYTYIIKWKILYMVYHINHQCIKQVCIHTHIIHTGWWEMVVGQCIETRPEMCSLPIKHRPLWDCQCFANGATSAFLSLVIQAYIYTVIPCYTTLFSSNHLPISVGSSVSWVWLELGQERKQEKRSFDIVWPLENGPFIDDLPITNCDFP